MKNFAFFVSANATRLVKFLEQNSSVSFIKQIKFVLIDNKKNNYLKKLCQDRDIVFYEIDYRNIIDKNMYISNIFLEYLQLFKIDFAFIFANKILVGEILLEYENKLINFHPSLLPAYKGLYAIDQGLEDGALLLGNTAHIVTKDLDGGIIVMQNIFPAIDFKTYDDVLDKQLLMLKQLILWIDTNRLIVKNNSVHILGASYNIDNFIPNLELIND